MAISSLFMIKSIWDQGMIPRFPFHTKFRKELGISGFFGKRYTIDKIYYTMLGIESRKISYLRIDILGDSIRERNLETWGLYIGGIGMGTFDICYSNFSSLKLSDFNDLKVFWNTMTQGQLLGNMGDERNGGGMRKKLKITVAHFNNTALLQSCAKTLLGRCMNPVKQNMAALLTKLPKIWNLEGKVTGKDLGLGKFQFEFEEVEDIEGVLQLQPYHFDYWMIAVAKWQPKRDLNFPAEIPFWVRVLGIPKEYRTAEAFESIGDAIGQTVKVDLD